jgi:predicted component of type VI protein secretion system
MNTCPTCQTLNTRCFACQAEQPEQPEQPERITLEMTATISSNTALHAVFDPTTPPDVKRALRREFR